MVVLMCAVFSTLATVTDIHSKSFKTEVRKVNNCVHIKLPYNRSDCMLVIACIVSFNFGSSTERTCSYTAKTSRRMKLFQLWTCYGNT